MSPFFILPDFISSSSVFWYSNSWLRKNPIIISPLWIFTSKFIFLRIMRLSLKYIGLFKYTDEFEFPLISNLFIFKFCIFSLISHKISLSNIFFSVEFSKLIVLFSNFWGIFSYSPQFCITSKDAIIYSLNTIRWFGFIFFNSRTIL